MHFYGTRFFFTANAASFFPLSLMYGITLVFYILDKKFSEYFMEKYTLEFMGIEKYEDFHTAKFLHCTK